MAMATEPPRGLEEATQAKAERYKGDKVAKRCRTRGNSISRHDGKEKRRQTGAAKARGGRPASRLRTSSTGKSREQWKGDSRPRTHAAKS